MVAAWVLAGSAFGVELNLNQSHPGLAAAAKAYRNPKVDSVLTQAVEEYRAHAASGAKPPFRPSHRLVQFVQGQIVVDAIAAGDSAALLEDLTRMGLRKGNRYGRYVSGLLPIAAVERAGTLGSLRYIRASLRPLTQAGNVQSQGDAAIKANVVRDNGVDGAGVIVGVISDSYDQQGGAAADIQSGNLPAGGVTVLDDAGLCDPYYGDPCTDEGRAMLQIVHDVAPGANLAFHTAYNGIANFASGIGDLADAGADVIVDDVIYLNEPMFQDGVVAQAVDEVASRGVAYFSAAGNQARDSYEYPYVSSSEVLYIDLGFGPQWAGVLHDFDPTTGAVDWGQKVTIPYGYCAIIVLQWDSPFGSGAGGNGTQNDLDFYLTDDTASSIVAYGWEDNLSSGEPIETIQFCNDGVLIDPPPYFNILVSHWAGNPPGRMKYVVFGEMTLDEYATNSSTSYGHANAAGAEAVGAAYWKDTPYGDGTPGSGKNPPLLEPYSSAGGTPILLNTSGQRLAAPIVREKPEIVAPDGVNTTFFYFASDRNGDGIPDFSGTSAAAPHAAGVAALMLQAAEAATPAMLYQALETTAIDMAAPRFDFDSGYGLIQADAAIVALGAANQPPVAVAAATPTSGPAPLTVQFTGNGSSDPENGTLAYAWNFGDEASSSIANPSHTYNAAGNYTAVLTVTDNGGLTDADSLVITVLSPPPPLHIGDLDGSRSVSRKSWSAKVTIAVHDGGQKPVSGAAVSGSWSPGGSSSCTTSGKGTCTVSLSNISLTNPSVTFAVTGVTKAGYGYVSSANHDPDGDSNGTGITINK